MNAKQKKVHIALFEDDGLDFFFSIDTDEGWGEHVSALAKDGKIVHATIEPQEGKDWRHMISTLEALQHFTDEHAAELRVLLMQIGMQCVHLWAAYKSHED